MSKMFERKEDDNRGAEVELDKGYHGNDDSYHVRYDDGSGAGLGFSSEQDAQDYIDKK